MYRIFFGIVYLLAVGFIISSCSAYNSRIENIDNITEQEAIEIGSNEAIRLDYNIETMELRVLKNITPWDNDYPSLKWDGKIYVDINNKLSGKEYWAVDYNPPILRHGGEIVIFVDAISGEVITVYEGH